VPAGDYQIAQTTVYNAAGVDMTGQDTYNGETLASGAWGELESYTHAQNPQPGQDGPETPLGSYTVRVSCTLYNGPAGQPIKTVYYHDAKYTVNGPSRSLHFSTQKIRRGANLIIFPNEYCPGYSKSVDIWGYPAQPGGGWSESFDIGPAGAWKSAALPFHSDDTLGNWYVTAECGPLGPPGGMQYQTYIIEVTR
jgi:hypothetical protein